MLIFYVSLFFSVKNIRLGEQLVLKNLYSRIRPYFWGLMLKSNQKSIWPKQLVKICILLALQHSASKVCSCYSICVKSWNSMQWEIKPCTYYHRFLGLSTPLNQTQQDFKKSTTLSSTWHIQKIKQTLQKLYLNFLHLIFGD